MNKVLEIPDIFLAYVFTLLVGRNAVREDIDTSIQDSIFITYNNNKDMVLEFIEDALRSFVLPIQLSNNPNTYYRSILSDNGIRTYLTEDNTIQNSVQAFIENYAIGNILLQNNKPSWNKCLSNFEKEYLSEDYTRSNIVINSVEYLPIIIQKYFEGNVRIELISFNITGDRMQNNSENPLYIHNEEESELQFNRNFTNYDFSCTIDLTKYEKCTSETKPKKPTETELLLDKIDMLVNKVGEGKYVSFADLSKIILKSGKVYANKNRRIENVISDYRNKKATKLTLDTKDQESYQVIKNSDYIR